MHTKNIIHKIVILALILCVSSCKHDHNTKNIQPLSDAHFKVGAPYTIAGITYYPKNYDYDFTEIGTASWYGELFHKKKTANGEIFNRYEVSAAHKTLPLPSIVLVTNLENGKQLLVKVNDRGPYVADRIIDLSERAAILLGFNAKGLTQVKVQFLKKATEEFIAANPIYKKQYNNKLPDNANNDNKFSYCITIEEYFPLVPKIKHLSSVLRDYNIDNFVIVNTKGKGLSIKICDLNKYELASAIIRKFKKMTMSSQK